MGDSRGVGVELTDLATQLCLYLAEKLIYWASKIAPAEHPDGVTILTAALYVFTKAGKAGRTGATKSRSFRRF